MPDKALDQGQTIDDLILDILADEAQIIRCLRIFFCNTLQELSERYAHCPELKIRFADNLITAAAKKEEALAAVLNAISLFEVIDDFTPLLPGESYPLPQEPSEVLRISFEALSASGTISQMSALFFGSPFVSVGINDILDLYELVLTGGPYPVENVGLKNTGSSTIYIRNVTTSSI